MGPFVAHPTSPYPTRFFVIAQSLSLDYRPLVFSIRSFHAIDPRPIFLFSVGTILPLDNLSTLHPVSSTPPYFHFFSGSCKEGEFSVRSAMFSEPPFTGGQSLLIFFPQPFPPWSPGLMVRFKQIFRGSMNYPFSYVLSFANDSSIPPSLFFSPLILFFSLSPRRSLLSIIWVV